MKVFFPISEGHLERRINENTCVLLISQSGQTFSTLHATHKLANIVKDKLWILTGCNHSKMEFALVDSYRRHGLPYAEDRVIDNKSGHRPAEPTSVAVAATWHSLTRLLMHLIFTTRALLPSARMVHEWVYTKSARIIQTFVRRHAQELRRLNRKYFTSSSTDGNSSGSSTNRLVPYEKPPVLMRLTDGCIKDLNSLLSNNLIPNICAITGRDIKGKLLNCNDIQSASLHPSGFMHSAAHTAPSNNNNNSSSVVGAKLTAASVVGDLLGGQTRNNAVHEALIQRGKNWANHINEPWQVMVLVAVYFIISVGFGMPIFGLLGDAFVAILRQMGANVGEGVLIFSVRYPHTITGQYPGWAICGLLLQILDAFFFVYIGKNITRILRIVTGRPYCARAGKRTIVIVDNPTVHQLLENFVSKLYSQSYGVVGVEVHGASGLDHFVHRFTHRVVRGVLIAVGRPDGRLCCLGK